MIIPYFVKSKRQLCIAVSAIHGAHFGLERILSKLDCYHAKVIFLGNYFGDKEHEKTVGLLRKAKQHFPGWIFLNHSIGDIRDQEVTSDELFLTFPAVTEAEYQSQCFIFSSKGVQKIGNGSDGFVETFNLAGFKIGQNKCINAGFFDDGTGNFLGYLQVTLNGEHVRFCKHDT